MIQLSLLFYPVLFCERLFLLFANSLFYIKQRKFNERYFFFVYKIFCAIFIMKEQKTFVRSFVAEFVD